MENINEKVKKQLSMFKRKENVSDDLKEAYEKEKAAIYKKEKDREIAAYQRKLKYRQKILDAVDTSEIKADRSSLFVFNTDLEVIRQNLLSDRDDSFAINTNGGRIARKGDILIIMFDSNGDRNLDLIRTCSKEIFGDAFIRSTIEYDNLHEDSASFNIMLDAKKYFEEE